MRAWTFPVDQHNLLTLQISVYGLHWDWIKLHSLRSFFHKAKSLQQFAGANQDFQQIADGINRGVTSWQKIQANIFSL